MRQILDWSWGATHTGMLTERLAEDGIRIVSAPGGPFGMQQLRELQPDGVLLGAVGDVRATARLCADVRRETSAGLIVIVPTYDEAEAVEYLDSGADDCVVYCGNDRELAARIRTVLRRGVRLAIQRRYTIGELEIDAENRTVQAGGREVVLTPLEFRLLVCLAANPGRSLSPGTLIRAVQGYSVGEQDATHIIKALVWRLRKKIETDPSRPEFILNVRGSGYILDRMKSEAPEAVDSLSA